MNIFPVHYILCFEFNEHPINIFVNFCKQMNFGLNENQYK